MLFAILYILSIARICHCGDDKAVLLQPPSAHASPPSTETLDISEFNPVLYTVHYYNDNGNDVIFVVHRDDILVTRVVHGRTTIWTPEDGENFEYTKVYTKDGEPRIVFIAKSKDRKASGKWYARNGDVWEDCNDTYQGRIKDIQENLPRTNPFILNLEEDRDTLECRIFNVILFEVPARLYYAKPGFKATDIMHNGKSIWKSGRDRASIRCNLYYKNGEPSLLVILTKIEEKEECSPFHMQNREWKEISTRDFYIEREELRAFYYSAKEEEHPPHRPWWSACLGMFTGTAHETVPASLSNLRDPQAGMVEIPTLPIYSKPEENQESSEDNTDKDKQM
ncbi:hypothetical protein BEWA_029570 [Theileria equi strain WA]|uniref:Signal peptide containing protein n=1 Tax=Theileria equi strain WA TaxID=1537102 RepID=L0AWY8_THEEQ|nr:hypothetical protein BEWA_029570 [Theileria equi strain WA]AFZ80107.1 hypothetical protein BEWA_029570 [Theileria equi strain WA]|eukprot:XP_004829773.1 hypothetical protein BEWA_029570 [Theileria equi strain WA]